MTKVEKLYELAAWYREFAERTGNPWVWAARLRKAAALEAEARRLVGRGSRPHLPAGEARSPRSAR
jgi:hypothetical protein